MTTARLEIFDADGTNPRVRWQVGTDPVSERRLDRAEVDRLIADVEAHYGQPHPPLGQLGAQLYGWADGPTTRWLAGAWSRNEPLTLEVSGEERLRALPWELLHSPAAGFLALHPHQPVSPVRIASPRTSPPRQPANRPLRVLFMASSPLGVEPPLDYEAEEAQILRAAPEFVDVTVEESGSLDGLGRGVAAHQEGFDVVHLSGHGAMTADGPRLVMEDDFGEPVWVSADDVARSLRGHWPRLLFLSGCWTGTPTHAGSIASMAEALVRAGAPAVLGWGLPVGDTAASDLAAALYRALGEGETIVDAVARARESLAQRDQTPWHLLRLYADRTPLGSLVTPINNLGRALATAQSAAHEFLDHEGRVRVADRLSFVGRRRDLQGLLRTLRATDPEAGQGVVIHGMGGLGKSSLTARVVDRMRPTHPHHAVWTGKITPDELLSLTSRMNLPPSIDVRVNELLATPHVSMADRLRYVLSEPLASASERCLFVFDDFENGNLEPDGRGGHVLTPDALNAVCGLAEAIRRSNNPSRIVITSRHGFPLPQDCRLAQVGINPLADADLTKKLNRTRHLGDRATTDERIRQRAIAAAAGIPRLIERIDAVLETDADPSALLTRIAATEVGYREELLLQALFDGQPPSVRRVIVLAAVYHVAVPLAALTALDPEVDLTRDIEAAVRVGLIQTGPHPTSSENRYLVSSLLEPILLSAEEHLDADAARAVARRAAQTLYGLWVDSDGFPEESDGQ